MTRSVERVSRAVTEWATGAAESCTTDMNA